MLTGLQLVKIFPAFHRTRRFITALTSVRHLSVSWASPIQSIYPTSHLLEIHPNIIHPSTTRSSQWSPSVRFPHQDPLHPLSSPIRATCPAHLILLDFITRTILGEEYKSFSSSLCSLLRYLVPPRSKYFPQHHVLKHPHCFVSRTSITLRFFNILTFARPSGRAVCGCSPAETVGSNPTGGMDVHLLCLLCVVRWRSLRRADHSSRGVLPTVVRRCV